MAEPSYFLPFLSFCQSRCLAAADTAAFLFANHQRNQRLQHTALRPLAQPNGAIRFIALRQSRVTVEKGKH